MLLPAWAGCDNVAPTAHQADARRWVPDRLIPERQPDWPTDVFFKFIQGDCFHRSAEFNAQSWTEVIPWHVPPPGCLVNVSKRVFDSYVQMPDAMEPGANEKGPANESDWQLLLAALTFSFFPSPSFLSVSFRGPNLFLFVLEVASRWYLQEEVIAVGKNLASHGSPARKHLENGLSIVLLR